MDEDSISGQAEQPLTMYSPETLKAIEDTGLNLNVESLRDLQKVMTDTSGKVSGAVDHYSQVTGHLVELMNRDERRFLDKCKQELFNEKVFQDAIKRYGIGYLQEKVQEIQDPNLWNLYVKTKNEGMENSGYLILQYLDLNLEAVPSQDRILILKFIAKVQQDSDFKNFPSWYSPFDYRDTGNSFRDFYESLGPNDFRFVLGKLMELDYSGYGKSLQETVRRINEDLKEIGKPYTENRLALEWIVNGEAAWLKSLKEIVKDPALVLKATEVIQEKRHFGERAGLDLDRMMTAFVKYRPDLMGLDEFLDIQMALSHKPNGNVLWDYTAEFERDPEALQKAKLLSEVIERIAPSAEVIERDASQYSELLFTIFHKMPAKRSVEELKALHDLVYKNDLDTHFSHHIFSLLWSTEKLGPGQVGELWEEVLGYADLKKEDAASTGVFLDLLHDMQIHAVTPPDFQANSNLKRATFESIKNDLRDGTISFLKMMGITDDYFSSHYISKLLSKGDRIKGRRLLNFHGVYGSNPELGRILFDLLEAGEEAVCNNLQKAKGFIDFDLERAKIARVYFEEIDVYDEKSLRKFHKLFVEGGKAKAMEMLDGIKTKAKGLIGTELPTALREDDEYMLYINYVFQEGNYSNYENNLACGDALEHVEGYKFEKSGYPTQMTGLLGYELKEGKVEDAELLDKYTGRLECIRGFVASRGPDNLALQKAFEEKVDALFEKEVLPQFKSLEELTVKEKLLVLALNVILKRARQEPYEYNMGDLIVEYKYAFHENLEGYIQRTADETSRFKDPVSKNVNLWKELSNIYGENLKHVLRHDLFEEFEKESKHKDAIRGIFDAEVGGGRFELKDKQRERFQATFDNPKIPQDKRLDALRPQCLSIFGTNIKFESENAKSTFNEELKSIVDSVDAGVFFETSIPRLAALRQRYLFDLNAKLEELFNADIHAIDAEISKYDEVTETEMKQTQMGGEKSKAVEKTAKKRQISGFITKTKETANARMGAYLCIAGDQEMWKNPNYFELVLKDEESGKCVGLVMLVNIEAADGKKYLWFGPNPFEGFLGQVSSEQCYKYMYDTVTNFAQENGYDGVVVPSTESQILGACTNRGGDFPELIKKSMLRDASGELKVVEFGKKHQLGGSYGYEDGALVWEKVVK